MRAEIRRWAALREAVLRLSGIALVQAVGQIPNEVLFSGAERKGPGMQQGHGHGGAVRDGAADRKSTRLNSSHL